MKDDARSSFRNISDTALWAAEYRARESERPDAIFRDPLARRLAGSRGAALTDEIPNPAQQAWAWVARTFLFDEYISDAVAHGADTVVNLAAGLDARPYRMDLPSTLRWIEIDLPDLIAHKEEALRDEQPTCRLERLALDLTDVGARRELLGRLGADANRALIVSEGLLIYLTRDEAAALAGDLAAVSTFDRWIIDIASPGLLRLLLKEIGQRLDDADAPLKFAPPEGPGFFRDHGWEPVIVKGLLKTAGKLERLNFGMRILSWLSESTGRQGARPWSGVCRLDRNRAS